MWLTLVIAAKVVLVELCRRFMALGRQRRSRRLAPPLRPGGAALGLTWAGFALVGIHEASAAIAPGAATFSSHVFIFASLIVLLAVRMTFASTLMTVFYVGTVPMTVAVVTRLVMLHDPFYYALATMAVGVHVYFAFLAKGLQQTALQMLAFRAQKDVLIAELDEERHISEEARRHAEAGSKAKSRFLATMSHELRTPLNAIMGFSEVMKDEVFGPHVTPVYREYAHATSTTAAVTCCSSSTRSSICRASKRAGTSFTRSGRISATSRRTASALLRLRAESKGLEVAEKIAPDLPQVWADPRALRQITINLLSNALKFTPPGGRVILTVAQDENGGQYLSVRDTGPGIPSEELPKVIQAFGQGSLAHETAEGGTGLGLPIVKSLIELHGGTFEISSELRRGTEVVVTLPPQRVLSTVAPLPARSEDRPQQPIPPPPSTRAPRLRPSPQPGPSDTPRRRIGSRW